MKLWKASFNGVWLGGLGIVAAPDYGTAYTAMHDELVNAKHGLTKGVGNLEVEELELKEGQAVVLWNGDY